ncbi:RICIN domain-containing protein [Kineosporia sp. J2-2]|uniref:RICIN domain-containing protein n=1 Tax=Kineosporia corallincola TaxID=2835133 RepID=A0ABS5TTY8_9ACTN|nr:RICIN domain-containing protein [Kineosporia corallincola]MBT0774261.1 RICIN domain-containing protein [Kineosporia corallincola]
MSKFGTVPRALRRLASTTAGRLELLAVVVVLALLGALAVNLQSASAEADKIPGRVVPEEDMPAVVTAALSCPTLTPARVAGQLMAISGFAAGSSGARIAGLSDAEWQRWKPSDEVSRSNAAANILALGHQMCELAGQIRQAGVDGDRWELAVAAQHDGLDAVVAAKGVPAATRAFVDTVAGYALWYADQAAFSTTPVTPTETASATAVPEALVSRINDAGRVCAEVTPARVAAYLGVASGFDANLRTARGEGIAQFAPDLWEEYASSKASVWDPDDAISTLAATLCDMVNQFSAFHDADAFDLALGALQWGPEVIRQAGGLPRTAVSQLAVSVPVFVPVYQKDTRLTAGQAAPVTSSATPAVTSPARPSTGATATPTTKTGQEPSTGAGVPPVDDDDGDSDGGQDTPTTAPSTTSSLYDPNQTYHLENLWAKAVLELPGDQDSSLGPGTRVQMWADDGGADQTWKLVTAPDGEHVLIENAFQGMALAVQDGAADNQAKLVVETVNTGDADQQWSVTDAGGGAVWITNRLSGKAVDLFGDDLPAPESDGTWNGYLVEQWDLQTAAQDQKWLLRAR